MNWKSLTIGFAAGVACMVTTSAIAASVNVTAILTPDVFFNVNGEIKAPPEDQPVLNYNNRVYVPIRYAAELANCEIDWDVANRKVVLTPPKAKVIKETVEVPVEKIVYVDRNDNPDTAVYSKLPIVENTSDYKIEITGVSRDESLNTTKVFVRLKNKSDDRIQLDQGTATLVVDGKEYPMRKNTSSWDMAWYSDMLTNDVHDGYLIFDLVPEDYEKATLTFKLRTNGSTDTDEEELTFNFLRK